MNDILLMPILPLRGSVLFPELAVSVIIGRAETVEASRVALQRDDQSIAVFAQRDYSTERISDTSQLYRVGTRGIIESISEVEEGFRVKIVGVERIFLEGIIHKEPFLSGAVRAHGAPVDDVSGSTGVFLDPLLGLVRKLLELVKAELPVDLGALAALDDEPLALSYAIATMFGFGVYEDQKILEAATISETLRAVLKNGIRQLKDLEGYDHPLE
ncbi:MAG: LON peptidase substrate-binding domain-containing protein [Bdellovibrionia bacterium]